MTAVRNDHGAIVRSVRLYGALVGPIWWPASEAQLPVSVDLRAEAARFVNATGSGLIEAVKIIVDGAGDFQHCRLTADSFVLVEHRRLGPPDGHIRSWARRVDLTALPSLADYVAADTFASWDGDA
jgi:hypothetical protein